MSRSDSESDSEGKRLFDDYKQKNEEDPPSHEHTSKKRIKKHKKDKHKMRKMRHVDEEQEESESAEGNEFIEDEAAEDSEEEEELNSSAEIEDEEERKRYEEMYGVKKKRETEKYLERLEGKNEKEINKIYHLKANKRRENQEMLPSDFDHKMFIVHVKQGKEEEMVFRVLNKASYYSKNQDNNKKVKITTAMALKKKYPGKIFVEAQSQKEIREAFDGFIDVNLKVIKPLDNEFYSNLFENKQDHSIQFKENQFIRIKKGVYENDLGKIYKIKKASADVILVPRINIQEVYIKMKEETVKLTNEAAVKEKKDQILKKYSNPRIYYPKDKKPPKKLLFEDSFKDFSDFPGMKKIKITEQGLIILTFRLDEIMKPQGTVLPIELQPFSKNGNIVEDFQDQEERKNLISTVHFVKGDEAEIIAGELQGCFGVVVDIKENTLSIKCKNKDMAGKIIEEHIDHLSKRFKEGQRVKVVSGSDKGKTGLILKVEGRYAQILTDNDNTIKINKNNLEVHVGQIISQENVHGLKKDDLIKTAKQVVGIVISTNKDNIKILDTNNTVLMIGNLDFDSKINTNNLVTKNRTGDQIKNQTIIRIRKGTHEGHRCEVKHVYRDFVFVFNAEFDKTCGVWVERSDNCMVVAKVSEKNHKPFNNKNLVSPIETDDELKVGKAILIGSGPLKGYRGVIKNISKDRIEVRVPQKNCTEWIQRDKISAQEQSSEMGRTPRRGVSMTTMYAQSPMNL